MLVLLAGSAEARTLKGQGPTTIAVAYGAAWVGFGNGTVTRVDARTLRLLRRPVELEPGGYVASIATGFESVWVAPHGTPIRRLDPESGKVRASISNQPGRWSGSSGQVATGAGSVWIADHERNAILRVNPRTNRISRRKRLAHRLRSIAVGPSGVWVQTLPGTGPVRGLEAPRIVSRLDRRTLRLHRAFRLPCEASLEPAGDLLWVLDDCDGSLRRFDTRAGTLSRPVAKPGAMALAAGFGSIWVSDGPTIRRVQGGRVTAEIKVRGRVAVGAGFVWVLDSGNGVVGWLRRIDPATNRVVGRPIRLFSSR